MIRKNRDVCLLCMLHRKSVQRSDLQMNRVSTADVKKKKKKTDLKGKFMQRYTHLCNNNMSV